MGVDKIHYVMLGVDVSDLDIDLWNDKYLPYIEGQPQVENLLVHDGRMGEYAIFGVPLVEGNGYEGMSLTKLPLNYSVESRLNIAKKASELFDKNYTVEDVNLYAFTHLF